MMFPSAKNWLSVRPKLPQIASNVGMVGSIFRLKRLEIVDWESPASFASLYSVQFRSSISYFMRLCISSLITIFPDTIILRSLVVK